MQDNSHWYQDAIFYEVHVRAFYDANGDGRGDFGGLMQKLDYIKDLGADCVWLLPFYPSPLRDDGYDIADFIDIHPDYGNMDEFQSFLDRAHQLGIRVIADLVFNHTSDQHPWFQQARRSVTAREHDYYVWSKDAQKYSEARIIFLDTEKSNWSYNEETGEYYWHRFFSHQPDLNYANPEVREAMIEVAFSWLDRGLDGLRCDAAPYLFEREGTNCENLPETHAFFKEFRSRMDIKYADRILLAEANQLPADVRQYFGEGDEFHMAFHFPLMPNIFMALSRENRQPIINVMSHTPPLPDGCQWGIFLRNHDEVTLEMVTALQRAYMWQTYASDSRMRLNLGIRRRLAPLVDNDRRKVELLNSILLTMQGSPVLYYGDEIGMGDNIYLGDRNGVRTPMQWCLDRNAGFSQVDPEQLYLPVISNAVYGYQSINVEAQLRTPSSLLNTMKNLIAVRKKHQAFGRGTLEFLRPRNSAVLAYLRRYNNDTLLIVQNLANSSQPVELDLKQYKGAIPIEMLGEIRFPRIGELPYLLTLSPYGFLWFRLETKHMV
ncbi:MAG TPA: maltose alpha-D-glucosyltransferase [Dehalococcoidia bacterium]|nr:maltose alpha-D-glucosyltransferase [Dehalococcoidia bacterium]